MTTAQRKLRLLAIASHPIQYFAPVYKALSEGQTDFSVAYCRPYGIEPTFDHGFQRNICWEGGLLEGYKHEFLPNFSPIRSTLNPLHAFNPSVVRKVWRAADVLWINGVNYPTNWLAVAAARARNIPVLFQSDMREETFAGRRFSAFRRAYYSTAMSAVSTVLSVGTRNARAYRELGVPVEAIASVPFSVDLERFEASSSEIQERRAKQRKRWEVADTDVVVIFIGKLLPRKRPEMLLALDKSHHARSIRLVWAGEGELYGRLDAQIKSLKFCKGTMHGFVEQKNIPDVLWAADVFAFPSVREPWGLALNEAMAAALPAVVSADVGAAVDLCLPGRTGIVVNPDDEAAFIEAVDYLAGNKDRRLSMGQAAARLIATWSPKHSAAAIESAAFAAVSNSRTHSQ